MSTQRAFPGPVGTDLPTPSGVLAIGAHPDDVEFGCGATLAKWAADGCVVHHLVLTDGSKGTWNPDEDTAALVSRRRDEQRSASRALGATGEVRFADAVDGDLDASVHRRREVAAAIRDLRPGVVLGHDPWRRYRLHPDHRNAGWLTVDACVLAREPHADLGDGSVHHRPEHLLLFEADEANHVERVNDEHAEAKLAALLEHRSQWRSTMYIADDDDGTQLTAFRDRVLARLAQHGALADSTAESLGQATGNLGEAFHVLEL